MYQTIDGMIHCGEKSEMEWARVILHLARLRSLKPKETLSSGSQNQATL